MLVKCKITNFRSIKESQILSLEATTSLSNLSKNTFDPNLTSNKPLLKSMAIYGPNSSGKSNIIDALGYIKHFIIYSANEMQRGKNIQWVSPFKLNNKSKNNPTIFEIDFIHKNANGINMRFEYGFAVTKEQVLDEWLYEYQTKKQSRLFLRKYDANKQTYTYHFGKRFSAKTIADRTSKNVLFLSKAAQDNHSYLSVIFDWFSETLHVISSDRNIQFPIHELGLSNDFSTLKPKILSFLNNADINISDINIDKTSTNQIQFPEEMPEKLKEELSSRLKSIHFMPGTGEPVQFDFLHEESEGTKAMLALSKYWIKASEKPQVIILDEINKSLHPVLVQCLIDMFHNCPHNSQLIFTTHDVVQMDANTFRKDQILLVEKNRKTQSTFLYKISDIEGVRKEHVFNRRYMSGAFGALPITNPIEFEKSI